MANDETISLPAAPRAARLAREFVRKSWSTLTKDTLDNVTLCVSELVTNALDHAHPPYALRLASTRGMLRVEVADASDRHPEVKAISPTSARGRGMFIVSNIATTWGVDANLVGKTVWAEFAT